MQKAIFLSLILVVLVSGCVGQNDGLCTEEWNPVCGENGKTYGNSCQADRARIDIIHTGECESKPEPTTSTLRPTTSTLETTSTTGQVTTTMETTSTSTSTSTTTTTTSPTVFNHVDSTWTTSVLDSWETSSAGRFGDIAIDSDDVLHVVHYINAFGSNTDGVYYTSNSGSGWSNRELIDSNQISVYSRIEVDDNGGIHVAYPATTGFNLKYAYKPVGGTWSNEAIELSANNLGQYTSMAVSDDNVYIAYLDRTDNDLFVSSKAIGASAWSKERVYDDTFSTDTSIVIGNGVIHIAFVDFTGTLRHAYSTIGSGVWEDEVVDMNLARYPSIALDSSGNVNIAYIWNNGGDGDDGALMYASKDGTWDTEMIDDHLKSGEYASLGFDGNIPLISYHTRAVGAEYLDSYFKVAVKDGSWTTKTIESGGNSDDETIGEYSEIVVDSTGRGHVIYRYQSGGTLKYGKEE